LVACVLAIRISGCLRTMQSDAEDGPLTEPPPWQWAPELLPLDPHQSTSARIGSEGASVPSSSCLLSALML
jgi:hypothetical protein